MNRTKKALHNSVSTAFLQIITMIVGFITPRVMLNTYGSEINGLTSSISQFIAYFNLVEAGLAGAAVYALYIPLANKDQKAINSIVSAAKKFYNQSGYIFVSLTLGLAIIYPMIVETDSLSSLMVGTLVVVLGVNGALEFFTLAKYRVLLTADQKTYVISLSSTITIILNALIIIVLAHFKVNIVLLRFIALSSILVRSLILSIYVKVKYKDLNYKEKPDEAALNKRWDVLYLQILGAIHTGAPIIILTLIVKNLNVVSVYSIFSMVCAGLNGVLGIFTSGLFASFGDIIAREDKNTLQKAYREFELLYYFILTVAYSITFIMIMSFIRIYTSGITDINYDEPLIGFLIVLNGLLYNIKTPQGMLVISAGLYKETRIQTTIQGLIVVVLGIALSPFFCIVGVLLASICANLYRTIDLLLFISKNVTETPMKESAIRMLRVTISCMIIYIPFLFYSVDAASYLDWFVKTAVVGTYAVIVVLLTGYIFDRKIMMSSTKRMLSLVGDKK